MDLIILDTNLNAVSIIDVYESLVWTDRYCGYGDFELCIPMSNDIFEWCKLDYYVTQRNSDHVMIIEKMVIKTDVEDGAKITISGRSIESILCRRVVPGSTHASGTIQEAIGTLLNNHIIAPNNLERKIENFIFEPSDDANITDTTVSAQYTDENLYDIIQTMCHEVKIGFKVTVNDNHQFIFKLYAGVNRSYNQDINSYVVFSPNFDNLINSNYIESTSALRNVAIVFSGESDTGSRKSAIVGDVTGINRREVFVNASDIAYDSMIAVELLERRGSETLAEHKDVIAFEGQAETTIVFKYGEDFFDGDVVQIVNEYGVATSARISEIVTSVNAEGLSVYPTFEYDY